MNEHTWEKLDYEMRSEMSLQYMQERCPHEDTYVDSITVKVFSKPVGDLVEWRKYLATKGTESFSLYAEAVCERCGATQEQYIDIDDVLSHTHGLGWEE
jgi:hypothetical protein